MFSNDVGHVDVAISGSAPHAVPGGAGISVPLTFTVIRDVIHDEGLLCCVHCRDPGKDKFSFLFLSGRKTKN